MIFAGDDTRNSPSATLVGGLDALGAEAVIHDPYVNEFNGDLMEKAAGCDAVVAMVKHDAYGKIDLEQLKAVLRTPILIDGRRVFDAAAARDLEFDYSAVGLGL